uniref:Uncharacterized protein n=1 Tax=Romanomermis culicivorax TaxID=13658 RepID=A0A915JTV0_ROMCU
MKVKGDGHRSGLLKQQNKTHKTGRHRSKGQVEKDSKGNFLICLSRGLFDGVNIVLSLQSCRTTRDLSQSAIMISLSVFPSEPIGIFR